ncbi:MAG: polyprenyl synthetase family protein [Byssovorax sp.]
MVTESFEGQTQELQWISEGTRGAADADYEAMVLKKTCGYSFVAPARVGAAVARATPEMEASLVSFLRRLGLAFQITDDLPNLEEDVGAYGKEAGGRPVGGEADVDAAACAAERRRGRSGPGARDLEEAATCRRGTCRDARSARRPDEV